MLYPAKITVRRVLCSVRRPIGMEASLGAATPSRNSCGLNSSDGALVRVRRGKWDWDFASELV